MSLIPSTQECIQLCMSVIHTKFPNLSALALKVNGNEELLLRIILENLISEGMMSEADQKAHSNKQHSYSLEHSRWDRPQVPAKKPKPKPGTESARKRSYSMEHFRWGKPSGAKTQKPKPASRNVNRRAYSMEHFRWSKPSGRKRRPVKVPGPAPEEEASSEGTLTLHAQTSLNSTNNTTTGYVQQNQGFSTVGPKQQETEQTARFVRGSPPPPNGNAMKQWRKKYPGQLLKLLRDVIMKDVQRITQGEGQWKKVIIAACWCPQRAS